MKTIRYLPQRTGSSSGSEDSTNQHQQRALYASERARLLFGQYRRGDANDPEIYVATVAAILADYPPETIRYVTDPRTGIAANPLSDPETGRVWSGMPDAANVKRACELHYAPTRRLLEREKAAREQIAEREQLAEIAHHKPRKTYEELQAELAEIGIYIGKETAKLKPVDIGAFREKWNISQSDWDAIPNAAK